MRNMSFALTTNQVLAQSKDVTRRLSWLHAKPGDLVQPVVKAMGLRPGEAIQRLGGPVRILRMDREPLVAIERYPNDGMTETRREGFPDMSASAFVAMFCEHMGCKADRIVTRIAFSYDLLDGWEAMPSAPKDGTEIELLVRHSTWHYASLADRAKWQGPCRGSWLDFNGGGWSWSGHMGTPIAWRPAA
jgi:hypothetical protein